MVTDVQINGKSKTVVVLGDSGWVPLDELRKALFNMFECACLWQDFTNNITGEQMYEILQFIQAIGLPEEKKGGNA